MKGLVDRAQVMPISSGDVEILRRIFVTVRDRHWQEVAPTAWECEAGHEVGQEATHISARHTNENVDFEWEGALRTSADGRSVNFSFIGTALRDMDVCRLGLVVLHPVDFMIGSRLRLMSPAGEHTLDVSAALHPQPIVSGLPAPMAEAFSRLTIENPRCGTLQLQFEGDLFEIEDQRNWGDASFKTYCTPLRLGFPRSVKAGTMIRHSVKAHFEPVGVQRRVTPARQSVARRFPAIGALASSSRLAPVAWSHIHVDVDTAEGREALVRLRGTKNAAPVEVAGFQSLSVPAALVGADIARVLVYGEGVAPPSAGSLASTRKLLDDAGLHAVPMFAATRGHFVEINRGVPLAGDFAGVAVPLTATVHGDDVRTIAENVATIEDVAATARKLGSIETVAIAPLACYHPAASNRKFPAQLAAPWLAATLIHAAGAGIESVTLAEDVVSAVLALPSATGSAFLERILAFAGAELVHVDYQPPEDVHVLALKPCGQAGVHVLIVNVGSVVSRLPADIGIGTIDAARDLVSAENLQESAGGIELAPCSVACGRLVVYHHTS